MSPEKLVSQAVVSKVAHQSEERSIGCLKSAVAQSRELTVQTRLPRTELLSTEPQSHHLDLVRILWVLATLQVCQ